MLRRITAVLFSALFLLAFVGCSDSGGDDKDKTETTDKESSSSKTDKSEDSDTTDTTAKKKSTTTTEKDESAVSEDDALTLIQDEIEGGGFEFTSDQTDCLVQELQGDEELYNDLDALDGNPTTSEEWGLFFQLISSCMDEADFVDAVVSFIPDFDTYDSATQDCIKGVFLDLDLDGYAEFFAEEEPTYTDVTDALTVCFGG